MTTFFTLLALGVAIGQLHLQKKEIIKGNQIEQTRCELEKLKMALEMVKSEIDLREKIILDKKSKTNVDWNIEVQPHIDMVNKKLRPSMRVIQEKIINLYGSDISQLKELPDYFYRPDAHHKRAA